MREDLMNFELQVNNSAIIKVIGVGGGGSNAVNHMFSQGIKDVDFMVCNTDAQALLNSPVNVKIQLGESLTEGRGAGNKPDIGKQAAIESIDDVQKMLKSNTKMAFITAGMGGGTGTGAAPVIAKASKELGILTVAIVTLPFRFEGQQRFKQAMEGIREISQHVDSLLIINNEKLREIYGDLKLSEAFTRADNVLTSAAKGIAEIITVHGYINVDFADVQTVMTNSGVAIMGSGMGKGEERAVDAVKEALSSPLLNNNDIRGAKNILLNITSGIDEISMDEVGEITDYLSDEISNDVNIIWGTGTDESLSDNISVTIIATGFESNSIPEFYNATGTKKTVELKEKKVHVSREEMEFEVHTKNKQENAESKVIEKGDGSFEFIEEEPNENKFVLFEDNYPEEELELRISKKKNKERVSAYEMFQEKQAEKTFANSQVNEDIEKLESVPAFKRKKIEIDSSPKSSESNLSKYTLADDELGVTLKKNNPYLHDNVD